MGLSCPSCAGKEAIRQKGRFVCAFCGTRIVPRLEPGTLCGDDGGAGFCSEIAVALCRYCAKPLCDRHDAPKRYYWTEPLGWRQLCPRWNARDGADWGRLNAPFQRFPVPDFEPFEWVTHDKSSQYAVGQVELAITTAIDPVVKDFGGSVDDQACSVECLCNDCEAELTGKVDELARSHGERYREAAFVGRLEALDAWAEQALRYIEAFLGRPISTRLTPEALEGHLESLDTNSPRLDWDLWGHKIMKRREVISRLRGRLGRHNPDPEEREESP